MIIYTEDEKKRAHCVKDIQWLLICKANVHVWDHKVLWHSSASCIVSECSSMYSLIHIPLKASLMMAVWVNWSFPQRDTDTHSASSFQRGAWAGKLHSATDSTCFSLLYPSFSMSLSLPIPIPCLSVIFFCSFSISLGFNNRERLGNVWAALQTCHVYQKDMNQRQAGFPKRPHLDHSHKPCVK